MTLRWVFIFHIAAIIFAVIELGLTAYVSHWSDQSHYEDPYGDWGVNYDSPSQVNFLIFVSIFSLFTLAYTVPVAFITHRRGKQTHKYETYCSLVLDAVTTIFWLAGFIALAKLIGGPVTCSGSSDHFCAAIEASVAFGAFACATFMAAFLVESVVWIRKRRVGNVKPAVVATTY